MIEVKARILQRSVFIPEEEIRCEIIVTNHGLSNKNMIKNNISKLNPALNSPKHIPNNSQSLAYASAQIVCQCDVNERKVLIPLTRHQKSSYNKLNRSTSFMPFTGTKSHCLYSSEASILFCDLRLKEGESQKFVYKESIAWDSPPSYKGQNIKLSYKILIGVGRISEPLCVIKLPFRLFELKGVYKSLRERSKTNESCSIITCSSTASQSEQHQQQQFEMLANPFTQESLDEKYTKLDSAMDALTSLTVRRNLNTYNIQSATGIVGKFGLSKHYYRLGEDILGTFDFTEASINCFKYIVVLQIEETISKNCLSDPSSSNLVQHISLSRYEECCYLATKTNFLLHIPVTATSEFTHKIVSVRWRLRFEFIIEKNYDTEISKDNKSGKKLPIEKLTTETMLWDLPLHVVATNPIQASLMMQAESSDTIFL